MNRSTFSLVAVALATVVLAAESRATVVFQDSFESPTLADGDFVAPPIGWTEFASGATYSGTINPYSADYIAGTSDNDPITHGTVANMDGHNVAFTFFGNPTVYQKPLGSNLAANNLYTLSMSVGTHNVRPSHGYTLQLLAGGIVLDSISGDGSAFAAATFTPVSFSYLSPVSVLPAQELSIRFGDISVTDNLNGQSFFDLVTLDVQVPEPASGVALAAMSVLTLLGRGRRH
jgi:hypothetical protein